MAPVGAWLAIRGSFHPVPMVLALAVLAWVAGFDTIYACQDAEFDRREGLHSLPARLGVRASLVFARALHVVSIVLLASLFWLAPLHPLYLPGVAVIAGLLVYEHSLVSPADLSRVMQAFNLNGWVSLGYFATTLLAVILA
jgi:4-hydroxybenzoate polyprenyltransferase